MFETARMRFSESGTNLLTDEQLIEAMLRRVLYGIPEWPKTTERANQPAPEPTTGKKDGPSHDREAAKGPARDSAEEPAGETAGEPAGEPAEEPAEEPAKESGGELPKEVSEELPEEVREQILRRDKHRCRNCRQHLDVNVHHIVFRSRGGSHDPTNLITLCNTCHASVHRGFLVIQGNPDSRGNLAFQSGSGASIDRGVRPPPNVSAQSSPARVHAGSPSRMVPAQSAQLT